MKENADHTHLHLSHADMVIMISLVGGLDANHFKLEETKNLIRRCADTKHLVLDDGVQLYFTVEE